MSTHEKQNPKEKEPEDNNFILKDLPHIDLESVRKHISQSYGGGGPAVPPSKPSDKPDKPQKKLDWTEDFEIDPDKPQVKVEMDTKRWAEFYKQAKKNSNNFILDQFVCKPIQITVDDLIINLNCHGFSDTDSPIRFTIAIQSQFSNESSFIRRCGVLTNLRIGKYFQNNQYFIEDNGYFQLIKLRRNDDWSQAQLAEEYSKIIKVLALTIEIALKMLKHDKQVSIDIPKPRWRDIEENKYHRASGSEEVIEKIKGMEVTNTKLTLSDMGGNLELKEQIERLVCQYQNADFFEKRGVNLPKGILLYGPPGTGKTLAAKIFAGEIGRKFYHVQSSDILTMWYGESEKTIKNIFEHVEGQCIIFIDEIDTIGEKRDFSSEPTRRVLSELLIQLDGLKSRKDIILLGATNRKDYLDPALLRPGRFDRHIFVDKPDLTARKQIWTIHIDKQSKNAELPIFLDDIAIDMLAEKSEGLVGADIEEIIRRTKEKTVFESYEKKEDKLITTEMLITGMDLYRKERAQEEKQKSHIAGFNRTRENEN